MAATVDTRSPLPTFQRTPVIMATTVDSSPLPKFQRTPVTKPSPICLKVSRDAVDAEKKSFQSDCVRNNASKITNLGPQKEKTSKNPNEKRKVTAEKMSSKKESKDAGKKRSKKSEDTDMPKRPATAFILFRSRFKEELKKENPDIKSAGMLSKSAGTKWKSMTDEEKLPYTKLAAEEKAAYQTKLESYKNKQSTEDKEKHAANSGSDSKATDPNMEVVGDNMIDMP